MILRVRPASHCEKLRHATLSGPSVRSANPSASLKGGSGTEPVMDNTRPCASHCTTLMVCW